MDEFDLENELKMIDRKQQEMIQRAADRITFLILYSDLPRIDLEIEISRFKDQVLAQFPEKEALFEMLYGSRFRRLLEQWQRESNGYNG